MSDYLWTRAGEPDPFVAHLERVLGQKRRRAGAMPSRPWKRSTPSMLALLLVVSLFAADAVRDGKTPNVSAPSDPQPKVGAAESVAAAEAVRSSLTGAGDAASEPESGFREAAPCSMRTGSGSASVHSDAEGGMPGLLITDPVSRTTGSGTSGIEVKAQAEVR
jgi:hypothetical protein